MSVAVALVVGFACGAIPFGAIIARLRRTDLRRAGSGNIGAANAYRVLGAGAGLVVALLDALKGFLPVLLAPRFGLVPALVAAGALLGHVFTPVLGFRGGKGVATFFGATLALAPLGFAVGFADWLLLVVVIRLVSVASLAASGSLAVLGVVGAALGVAGVNWQTAGFLIFAALLILWTHRSNLGRLRRGTEPRFSWRRA